MTGLVVFWHRRRYFGRILGDDDVQYWCEKHALLGRHALQVGDSVRFAAVAHEKGPRAQHVVVVDEVPAPGSRRPPSEPATDSR